MLSALRPTLVLFQAWCNHLACTPPNRTSADGRYHTEEWWLLQIAPLIFKMHQMILWACAAFEIIYYLHTFSPLRIPAQTACLASEPNVHITPLFLIGVLAVALGTYIRLDCFKALGPLFTFDLTVRENHKLITRRFYGYVRHPAYTGSILLVVGLAFSHLSSGSWLTECGPLTKKGSVAVFWVLWWSWTLAVGVSRADAEDKQMKKLFGPEWDAWAAKVPYWFLPGLI